MTSEELRRFARRDWASAAAGKGEYWAARYQQHGATPAREAAFALLQHMRTVQPDYPSARHREEDLADHQVLRHRLDLAAHAFTGR
ncbi:MAG: hypothetical protein ABL982_12865 [Vicinamibacterales bacterium]